VIVATRAVSGTLASASAVGVVAAGGGLRSVLAAQTAVNVGVCSVVLLALSRAARAPLRPRVAWGTFRAMVGFGGLVVLAGLAYQTMLQGPPIVLAGHAATSQVAAFAVPNTVMQQLVLLATATSLGFFPFVSAGSAGSDRTHLADVYTANLRVTLLLMAPVAAYLAILGHPLLTTWIGLDFADDAIGPLRYLAVAAVALAVSGAPADVARGLGHPMWILVFTASAAAISMAGSFVVVTRYGATGVAGALCVALTCATTVFIFTVAHTLLGLRARKLMAALAGPVIAIGGGVALFAIGHLVWDGFAGAVATGAVGMAAYLTLAFLFVLDDRERAALRHAVPARLGGRWQTDG
jgi:O-antigen/teichoic acid export membrane protein